MCWFILLLRQYSSGFGFHMNINMSSSGYGDSNCYCMCESEHRCVYITVTVVWLSELLIMYIIYVIRIGDLSKIRWSSFGSQERYAY